jgi:hypothetical protein
MSGDPHPRSAHRAPPAGGLALLTPQNLVRQAQAGQARARQAIVRQALTRSAPAAPAHGRPAAQHAPGPQVYSSPSNGCALPGRHAPQRRAAREPQRTFQSLMTGLGAVIITSIVALSAFFVIAEERRGGGSATAPSVSTQGISSRQADPEPLTQQGVFPEPAVRMAPGAAPYQVTMIHSDTDCGLATTGDLGALLALHGCDQVVRARLTAPYGGYQVTAGIFNLAAEDGAARVSELTGTLAESGRGSFAVMGGLPGDPLAEPLAQLGWRNRGHYLLYCAIARPDGQLVADDDPYAGRITADLVEGYLGDAVIGRRALDP